MNSILPGRASRWLAIVAAFVTFPAWATVELRVEARPISEPIEAFVTITDTLTGDPVTGLIASNFTVTIDGAAVPLSSLTPPPSEDSDQKVSVVFVMDYTSSVTNQFLTAMESAVTTFIEAMNPEDFAAIIKFNNDNGANVVQAFTEIDDGANDQLLIDAVMTSYPGDGSNIIDAVDEAITHLATQLATLPAGPKAIILVTDGIDSHSSNATAPEVIDAANAISIPLFTVGIGNPNQGALALMTELATDTGGQFILAPTDQDIEDAYESIRLLLTSEYLLTIDENTIDDCETHTLEVTVDGQGSAEATFTRRECNTKPNVFSFASQTGLNTGVTARSNTVTISGLEAPAPVSIVIGSYSKGCGDSSTFTSANGTIANGETICVRHTTSSAFSTTKTTTLTIGGVSAQFSTTTRAEGGGGGGSGGGGATGALELLLVLGLLLAGRRRWA